jgi:hypothetical protein
MKISFIVFGLLFSLTAHGQQGSTTPTSPITVAKVSAPTSFLLVTFYRDGVESFAGSLKQHLDRSTNTDKKYVETIILEIQRSLSRMEESFQEHGKAVDSKVRAQNETALNELGHKIVKIRYEINTFEKDLNAGTYDRKHLTEHVTNMLAHLKHMNEMITGLKLQ